MYRVARIENGLTIATAEMPHMASVSLGIWVATGGRYEPAELNGVSHFIEHLLFKGTRRRNAREISAAVEGIGGDLNAFTSEENTCYYAKAHGSKFDCLLDVMMDMFLEATFPPVEIKKERSVIKEELALYLDQPHHQVLDLLDELLWPDHPLGRSVSGTLQSVDAIQRGQILRYRRAHYLAGTTLIAVAGNLKHERVLKQIKRFSKRFLTGRRPVYVPAVNDQHHPRSRCFRKDIAQAQLALGFTCCSRHDERRFALRLLSTILGENMSSRLFQVLREDYGLAYAVQSSINLFDDVGAVTITAGLDADNLTKAVKLIARELRRTRETAPTRKELRQARDYLAGQIDLGLESTESQMTWMGENLLAYQRIVPTTEIKQRLHEVTPAQIRSAARDFIRPDRFSLALVSPLDEKTSLPRALRF
jgi:predicted Zn-dependent peptidase